MAIGDVINGYSNAVADDGYCAIQPSAGVEWVVHNIYYSGAVEFYFYDGTNELLFDSDTTYGARLGAIFHCTNSKYIRIKNISGSTIDVGYDGIQTK